MKNYAVNTAKLLIITSLILLFLYITSKEWLFLNEKPIGVGDYFTSGVIIKTIYEYGWYPFTNEYLGGAWGGETFDFPSTDQLSYLLIKVIALFTDNWEIISRTLYVSGFVFSGLIAYFCLSKLNVSEYWSILGGVIFAFAPYHFLRIPHQFLAFYVVVPTTFWVLLFIRNKQALFDKKVLSLSNIKVFLSVVIIALSGVYYTYFSLLIILLTCLYNWFGKKRYENELMLVLFVLAVFLLSLTPYILHDLKYGKNSVAIMQRDLATLESNSLKITHLLLPAPGHRIKIFSDIGENYTSKTILNEEHRSGSLGVIGVFGFIYIFYVGFKSLACQSGKYSQERYCFFVLISLIMLMTIGGIESFKGIFFTPYIRSINRVSIYISFICIVGFVVLINRFLSQRKWYIKLIAFLCILPMSIFDQTPIHADVYDQAEYTSDIKFFKKLEEIVGTGAYIYQLPYWPFPEGGRKGGWNDYSHFKGYLFTNRIHWSYGATKGRDGDKWLRITSMLPIAKLVGYLSSNGYDAIYVDRKGFADKDQGEADELIKQLGEPTLISEDRTLLLFRLNKTAKKPMPTFNGLIGITLIEHLPKKRGQCNIDTFKEVTFKENNSDVKAVNADGWALDPDIFGQIEDVSIIFSSNSHTFFSAKSYVGVERPDVAMHYNGRVDIHTGFVSVIPVSLLPSGNYRIFVKFTDIAGEGYCETNISYVVN